MKIKNKKGSAIKGSGFNKENKFSIGDASVIMEILRSKLYSRPLQTAIQEYLSNARDASRESKTSENLIVTLPTKLDPVFKVRDFGPGLTPKRVEEVFVKYGASTKRKDNSQTGGFGIGAKSAWAYTDSFTVVSIVDGTKYTYLAHLGSNSQGSMDLIEEESTDEANGVEVSFGIQEKDILEATSSVFRTTNFWNPKPKIKGLMAVEIPREYSEPVLHKGPGFFLTKNLSPWFQFQSQKESIKDLLSLLREQKQKESSFWALVDGIPYSIESMLEDSTIEKLSKVNMFLEFKTGEVQINANREELVFSPELKTLINTRVKAAISEIESLISSRFKRAMNLRDLKSIASNSSLEMSALSGYHKFNIPLTIKKLAVTVRYEGNGGFTMTLPSGDSYAAAPFQDYHKWMSLTEGVRGLKFLTLPDIDSKKQALNRFYQNARAAELQGAYVAFTRNPEFYEELVSKDQQKKMEKALDAFIKKEEDGRDRMTAGFLNLLQSDFFDKEKRKQDILDRARKLKESKDQEKIENFGFEVSSGSQTLLQENPTPDKYAYLVKPELNRHGRNYEGFEKELLFAKLFLGLKVVVCDPKREENLKELNIPNLKDLYKNRTLKELQKQDMINTIRQNFLTINNIRNMTILDYVREYLPEDLQKNADLFKNTNSKKVLFNNSDVYLTLFKKDYEATKKIMDSAWKSLEDWIEDHSFLKIVDLRTNPQTLEPELKKLFKMFKK